MTEFIHSCGYHCRNPACVLTQHDELVAKYVAQPVQPANLSAELAAALTEVMVWIDNWSPSFTEDEEWAAYENAARTALKNAIAQPVRPRDIDWQSVGKLIEANDRAKSLGFMPGTSNWGSMLWKAIAQPLQPTLTDQQVANMSEKHHREGLAEWSQPVQPTEPIGCVGKDGCTILYFTSELLPFETDLYIHPPA